MRNEQMSAAEYRASVNLEGHKIAREQLAYAERCFQEQISQISQAHHLSRDDAEFCIRNGYSPSNLRAVSRRR
jgi:hypothetical protein